MDLRVLTQDILYTYTTSIDEHEHIMLLKFPFILSSISLPIILKVIP